MTGEYHTKALMKTTGRYMGTSDFCPNTAFGVGSCFDNISGNLSSAVFLANAYVDLGTWWCLTPFIGAGVGTARNMLSGVQDQGIISSGFQGFGYTNSNSAQWNLAWDVTAGLTYNVNEFLKVDLSWRYLNMGSPQTSVVNCQNTSPCVGAFYTLQNVSSQDFRVGLRWMFGAGGFGGFGGQGGVALLLLAAMLCRRTPISAGPAASEQPRLKPEHDPESGNRFSATIMLKQKARAGCRSNRSASRSAAAALGRTLRFLAMKERPMRRVHGILSIASLILGMASPALASDYDLPNVPVLRGSMQPPAPLCSVGPATFTRWSGFYFGGNVSVGSATSDFSTATRPLVHTSLQHRTVEDTGRPSATLKCSVEEARSQPVAALSSATTRSGKTSSLASRRPTRTRT